jgi:hypothetical protein
LPLINDSQEKEKKKFKGYEEAAGKTFIKKEEKKKLPGAISNCFKN